VLFDRGVEAIVPPRGGRRHVLHLMECLARQRAPEVAGTETDLRLPLEAALRVATKRALIFVVSDFIGPAGWERALALLAQRHEVIAIRLFDPLETRLPDLGLLPLQDPETGEQLIVDTGSASFRSRFERLAQARDERLLQALSEAGVDALELSTGDDLAESVLRFAELRRRSRARWNMTAPGGMPLHLRSAVLERNEGRR
jgi:uncharacterized protein (DUF58 family)